MLLEGVSTLLGTEQCNADGRKGKLPVPCPVVTILPLKEDENFSLGFCSSLQIWTVEGRY